jgi:lipoate-protein ligase A
MSMTIDDNRRATWRILKRWGNPVSSAAGLAIDETLSHCIHLKNSPPILHLYQFKPSVIVGKYQDIEAVVNFERCEELGVEFNRRHTGGGTVIMLDKVVALAFAISLDHPRVSPNIADTFNTFGGIIADSLRRMNIKAEIRPKNDIVVTGRKIAGLSASSEIGNTLLFHASLLVDFDLALMLKIMHTPAEKLSDKGYGCFSERMTTVQKELGRIVSMDEMMAAIQAAFEEYFGIKFQESELSEWEREKVDELVETRYANTEWLFSNRHPSRNMGSALKKTPGGLLQVYLALSGGAIEEIIITGDFFTTGKQIKRLESALRWTPADRKSITRQLEEVWTEDIIYLVNVPMLVDTILKAKENTTLSPHLAVKA